MDTSQSNNLWQIAAPQKNVLNPLYLSEPNSIITDSIASYPVGNRSSFILKTIVNNSYGNYLETSFHYKLDSDTLMDGGMIEISRDSGQSWVNVINDPLFDIGWSGMGMYTTADTVAVLGQPGFSGRKSFGFVTFFISDPSFNPPYAYWFRFTFASDSINSSKEGWLIDDIDFYGFLEGIPQIDLANAISIYPNPVNNQFTFSTTQQLTEPLTISFFDVNGKLAGKTESINGGIVNVPQLENGLYFVTFASNGFYRSKKMLIRQ